MGNRGGDTKGFLSELRLTNNPDSGTVSIQIGIHVPDIGVIPQGIGHCLGMATLENDCWSASIGSSGAGKPGSGKVLSDRSVLGGFAPELPVGDPLCPV